MSAVAQSVRPIPRPFLKWAGGKRKLLVELLARVNEAGQFDRYLEPFAGGAALFFELSRLGKLPRHAVLRDVNPNLIETYTGVRDHVDEIIELLHLHAENHSSDYYYQVRGELPEGHAARAARVIYLNRTCFNGLYRENSRGQFNVPAGRYKNPRICDEPNLRSCSEVLGRAEVEACGFLTLPDLVRPGDLVYLDPPYHPLSQTASFTAYSRDRFGEEDQRMLAHIVRSVSEKGAKILLSNSSTPLIHELYQDFRVEQVMVGRSVNSNGGGRGKVAEVLVRNF